MRKADLLRSIEARFPFRGAQRLLKSCGFPSAQTWTAIREKLDASKKRLDYHALNGAYIESLVASEKSIAAFNIGTAKRADLLVKLASIVPDPANNFVKKYPYILDPDVLAKIATTGTVFVGREILPLGTAFMFSTVRVTVHREKLPPNKAPATWQKQFAEFYGVRKIYEQSYDAVIIPADGDFIWISADCPLYSNDEYSDFAHIKVREAFNNLVGQDTFPEPINLFPLIGKFYDDTTEGSVISLSHLVSTSSVKHEKMRNDTCLREELFHKAGSDAVKGSLAAFAIGILWEDIDGAGAEVELHIEGTAKDASKADPHVDRAIVRKGTKPEDLNFAFKKVLHYIGA